MRAWGEWTNGQQKKDQVPRIQKDNDAKCWMKKDTSSSFGFIYMCVRVLFFFLMKSLLWQSHLIIFFLRWHPAVYHFCPLFPSQRLDNKVHVFCSSHWPPYKMIELSRSFSLCLRWHCVTKILLSSLLCSGMISVSNVGTHNFHQSVQGDTSCLHHY